MKKKNEKRYSEVFNLVRGEGDETLEGALLQDIALRFTSWEFLYGKQQLREIVKLYLED